MVDLTARLGPLTLPAPVLTASGCAGFGRELAPFVDLASLGAFVTPSLTLQPRAGRPTPRMAETPSGLLTGIGLQNPGLDAFLTDELPWLVQRGARVLVSLAGEHSDEFATLARRLRGQAGVVGLEVNLGCADLESRGRSFAADPIACTRIVGSVRRAADPGVPVFVKLGPDVTDIGHIARVCADSGADGLTLVNTAAGFAIDLDTLAPAVTGADGGLSGPALRPLALRCVWQVRRAVPYLPIIGAGGISSGRDALQFVLAGASAVAVGTAVFRDPSTPSRVLDELATELAERGFAGLGDAVGAAHRSRTKETR